MVTIALGKGKNPWLKLSRRTLNTLDSVNDRAIAKIAHLYYNQDG